MPHSDYGFRKLNGVKGSKNKKGFADSPIGNSTYITPTFNSQMRPVSTPMSSANRA